MIIIILNDKEFKDLVKPVNKGKVPINKGKIPINKGKKLNELYSPEREMEIRYKISKAQYERFKRLRNAKI